MASTRGGLWSRFLRVARPFFQSERRWYAIGLLGVLLAFILCLGGLHVLSSFMNRDFMTAVSEQDASGAVHFAILWVGVFATLAVVGVFKTFVEDRLRLCWRGWLTRHLINRYLAGRAYHRLNARTDVDNPDQRISEDVKTFTDHALPLLLILTNSVIVLVSFSSVLWSITPWLFLAAVLYALFGSLMTVFLGRRLVKLDVHQFKKEADLRYDLIQIRTHAEQIALQGGEGTEKGRLRGRLGAVVENMKGIIGLSRNISFFTTGYDYMILLLPLLIVAPLYIHGQVPLGALTQAQQCFLAVMAAFSLIVKEFQRISTFAAVVERLGSFCEALDQEGDGPKKPPLETQLDPARVAFEHLTLVTPQDGRVLVHDLSIEVPQGKRLLILGPKGSGRTSILRAVAGLWTSGQGRIVRPSLDVVVFLPQQPYLRRGSLREQLLYATGRKDLTDEDLLEALRAARFEAALERVGGLDTEGDWPSTLSLGEQQQLAFARLLLASPRFAFLDEPTSAMKPSTAQSLYEALAGTPISYISIGGPELRRYHDLVVEIGPDGEWRSTPGVRALSA